MKGQQYWCDERRICAALLRASPAGGGSSSSSSAVGAPVLTPEDIHAASEAKSFDYRVHLPVCLDVRLLW